MTAPEGVDHEQHARGRKRPRAPPRKNRPRPRSPTTGPQEGRGKWRVAVGTMCRHRICFQLCTYRPSGRILPRVSEVVRKNEKSQKELCMNERPAMRAATKRAVPVEGQPRAAELLLFTGPTAHDGVTGRIARESQPAVRREWLQSNPARLGLTAAPLCAMRPARTYATRCRKKNELARKRVAPSPRGRLTAPLPRRQLPPAFRGGTRSAWLTPGVRWLGGYRKRRKSADQEEKQWLAGRPASIGSTPSTPTI